MRRFQLIKITGLALGIILICYLWLNPNRDTAIVGVFGELVGAVVLVLIGTFFYFATKTQSSNAVATKIRLSVPAQASIKPTVILVGIWLLWWLAIYAIIS